ncbi:MAG: CoA-binding protein [Bryobacteraceae bacterium]
MPTGFLDSIEQFLAEKRWAIVGVSRRRLDFSRWLWNQFLRRGYEAVPVNPRATQLDGRRCYPNIAAIEPPPAVALLMTPRKLALDLVRQCAQAEVRRIWFYAAVGRGAASSEAIHFCRNNGMEVVAGLCPMMFLPRAGWLHQAHAGVLKLAGAWPARQAPSEAPDLKPGNSSGR